MNVIKHSVPLVRHVRSSTSTPASLTLRGLMLAVSAMASSMSGTTYAAEPSAVDYFVAKVMPVRTTSDSSSGRANPTDGKTAYASAQDQFVDQVLKGRFPEGIPISQLTNTPANSSAPWPDIGFLRSVSAR